jgi:hypothetical protein
MGDSMNVDVTDHLTSLDVPGTLSAFPGMSIEPTNTDCLTLTGWLDFHAQKPGRDVVSDSFELKIEVPLELSCQIPLVTPLGSRIPSTFHRLEGGALCLGSPTRQLLILKEDPRLHSFIQRCVIPYLYAFVLHERNEPLPFGELAHGRRGILEDFVAIYGVKTEEVAKDLVRLTGRPRRKANHHKCPCGSGKRLGKCHNQIVNKLRTSLGRLWFRDQYISISSGMRKNIEYLG